MQAHGVETLGLAAEEFLQVGLSAAASPLDALSTHSSAFLRAITLGTISSTFTTVFICIQHLLPRAVIQLLQLITIVHRVVHGIFGTWENKTFLPSFQQRGHHVLVQFLQTGSRDN